MRISNLGVALVMAVLGLSLTVDKTQAQFPLSIVAGPTFSNVSTDEFDTSSKTGFFAGVGTAFPLGESVMLQPYVAYVQKGASFEFSGFNEDDTYSYIEIPVFFSYGVPLGESLSLGLSAGPQVGFVIDCKEAYDDGTADYDCSEYDNFKSTEFGLVGAAGLVFPVGGSTLSVGGAYDYGLTDVFSDVEGGYKNRVFSIFVDYGFSIGGGM